MKKLASPDCPIQYGNSSAGFTLLLRRQQVQTNHSRDQSRSNYNNKFIFEVAVVYVCELLKS